MGLLLASVALVGACSDGSDDDGPADTSPTVETPTDDVTDDDGASTEPVQVTLADTGLGVEQPIALVADPVSGGLLIAERGGLVRHAVPDADGWALQGDPVIDLVGRAGDTSGERGLLGIEVSGDGDRLWVSYTSSADGSSIVDEYELGGPADARTADPATRRELLSVEQPFSNHNGGHITLGTDDMLYLGLGDGGAGGDPEGRAQDRSTLLGKLLRLDPAGDDVVPADNPFVGVDGARGEIWSTGLRNPWRFDIDPETGDLWVADVGQNRFEEVNLVTSADGAGRGANFGWDLFEGNEEFEDAQPAPGAASEGPFVEPLHVYGRDLGCSVTGGVVHRGGTLAFLDGHYLFSDYCSAEIRSLDPEDPSGTATVLAPGLPDTVGFGTDADGEVYVISLEEGIHRLVPA